MLIFLECEHPHPIWHGRWDFTKRPMETKFVQGTELQYSCNTGYNTTDETVLKCGNDGAWSPKQPPACNKGSIINFHV